MEYGVNGEVTAKAHPGDEFATVAPAVDLPVSRKWVIGVLEEAGALTVRAPTRGMYGVDGTTYRLTLRSGYSVMAFEWWVEAPPEFADVERLYRRIRSRFVREGGEGALDRAQW